MNQVCSSNELLLSFPSHFLCDMLSSLPVLSDEQVVLVVGRREDGDLGDGEADALAYPVVVEILSVAQDLRIARFIA